MTISFDQTTPTEGVIRVILTTQDYTPKVNLALKQYSRKASIKGFRKGKIPIGVIQKMYGKNLLVEQVNTLLDQSISDYIREHKLRVVGSPMPVHEDSAVNNWDDPHDFDFSFRIGIVQDFTLSLTKQIELNNYQITITEGDVDKTVQTLRQRYPDVIHPEKTALQDTLQSDLFKVDQNTFSRTVVFEINNHLPERAQEALVGLAVDDQIEFDLHEWTTDKKVKSYLFNQTEEEADLMEGRFKLKIRSIERKEEAKMGPSFYDRIFGPGVVSSETEFRAKVTQIISRQHRESAQAVLRDEIIRYLTEHTPIQLPEKFLKERAQQTNSTVSEDDIHKEFPSLLRKLKWELIQEKIVELYQLTVKEEEVKEKAKADILEQIKRHGMPEQPSDWVDNYTREYLNQKNKDGQSNYTQIFKHLWIEKIFAMIQEQVTLVEKPVTEQEYIQMLETRNKAGSSEITKS